MTILALDSSSPVVSVAFVSFTNGPAGEDSPEILFREETAHARTDSSPLFRSMQAAVAAHGRPDALCVGLGPGSYNGIRASIAVARGMATALGIPLHALPSPLGQHGPVTGFHVAGDARGGHYWRAFVREGKLAEEPSLLLPDELSRVLSHESAYPCLTSTPLEGIIAEAATPDAALLAEVAWRSDPVYRCRATPEPLYLKPPHITAPRNPITQSA